MNLYLLRKGFLSLSYAVLLMALSAGTVSAAQAEKPYYRAELIFEPSLCFPRCHSSQIHALPDGGLIAAWWNGSEEAGKDNVIRGARRPAGADYWETPMILGDTPDTTEGNPVFFSASQNELWLFYRAGFPWAKLMWTKSADLGETWSTPEAFWDKTGWALRSRIIRLRNGNIVIPALTYGSPKWELNRAQTIFIYSEDNGKSWKNTEMVRTDPGNNEAALFQRDDGSLLAYMRPYDLDRKDRFLWQCESFDNGRTWTEAKRTGIQNPSKAIELLKLINGHVVLAFNDTQNNLSSLSLALSLDDGRTWSHKRVLENSPGRFTYPALAQTPDGRIHVSYTFRRTHVKHAELNEAWIMDKQ